MKRHTPRLLWFVCMAAVAVGFLLWGPERVKGWFATLSSVGALVPSIPAITGLLQPGGGDETQITAAVAQVREEVRERGRSDALRLRILQPAEIMRVRYQQDDGVRHLVEELVEKYAATPTRLVVLGAAGAGKSALCVRILNRLVESDDPADPVPVLLRLSTWTDPSQSFNQWLTAQLDADFDFLPAPMFGRSGAAGLVMADRLRLSLDGLDELPPPAAAELIRSIRTEPVLQNAFVITSRAQEYLSAKKNDRVLGGTTTVELLPLDVADVSGYLMANFEHGANRWSDVLATLANSPDSPAASVLTQPLMLGLAAEMFERSDSDPGAILDLQTSEDVARYLVTGFPEMVYAEAATRGQRWPYRRARKHLHAIARDLDHLRGDDDVHTAADLDWWDLHRLVPKKVARTAPVVIGSVACTPLGMLIFGLFARLWFGAAFGALTGALGGLVVGFLPQEPPRRFTLAALLDPKARAGNPWAAVGFGAVGVAVGGLLGGLLYTPVDAVFAAVVAGTAFATARTATSPTVGKGQVTPTSSYASDRSAVRTGPHSRPARSPLLVRPPLTRSNP